MYEVALEKISEEVAKIVKGEGMELWHLEFKPERGSMVLRIYIDKPGKVTVDDCAGMSRQISMMLDVEDLVPGAYTLEVSSPGMDRILVKPEHFARYIGRMVKVRLNSSVAGRKKFTGRLRRMAENVVVLFDENEGQEFSLKLNDIHSARLEVEI
jgi:ribosome maturation factor RimP